MESSDKEPLTLREKWEFAAGLTLLSAIVLGFMAGVNDQGESIGPAAFRMSKELLYKIGVIAAPIGLLTAIILFVVVGKFLPDIRKGYRSPKGNPKHRATAFSIWGALMALGYTGNLLYALAAFGVGLLILRQIRWFNPQYDPNADVNDPELTKEFDALGLTVLGEATPMFDTVGDGVFEGLRTRLTRSEEIWDNTNEPYFLYTVQVESSIKDLRIVIRKAHSEMEIPKDLSTVTSSHTMQLNDMTVLSDNPSAASQWVADNIQAINTLMDWAEYLSLNVEPERYSRDEYFESTGLLTLDQDTTKPDINPDLRGIISQSVNFSRAASH